MTPPFCLREYQTRCASSDQTDWPEPALLKRIDKIAQEDAVLQEHRSPLVRVGANCNRVEAGGRVGFLVTEALAVEVFPKWTWSGSTDMNQVRANFVELLSYSRVFALPAGIDATVERSKAPLGEWILHGMARQLWHAIARGLAREYVGRTEPLCAVRGRIDLGRQVSSNMGIDVPVWCRFDEYEADTPLTRLLSLHASLIARLAVTRMVRLLALRCARELVGTAPSANPTVDLERLVWDRRNDHFRPAIDSLKILLTSGGLSSLRGKSPSWCVSVPMQDVFERYLARIVRGSSPSNSLVTAATQRTVGYLSVAPKTFKQIADLVLQRSFGTVIVDAKYKVPKEGLKPSEADVRQVLTYAALWNQSSPSGPHCSTVALVYPRSFEGKVHAPRVWTSFLTTPLGAPVRILALSVPFGRKPSPEERDAIRADLENAWIEKLSPRDQLLPERSPERVV